MGNISVVIILLLVIFISIRSTKKSFKNNGCAGCTAKNICKENLKT